MLRGLMGVSQLSGSEEGYRILIAVRSPDEELARSVAATVATEYQGQGNARALAGFEQDVESLNQRSAEQKRLVDEKRLLLDKAHREARQKLREAHLSLKERRASG